MDFNQFAAKHHYYNTPGKSVFDHQRKIQDDLNAQGITQRVKYVSGASIPVNAVRVGDFTGACGSFFMSGQDGFTYYIVL